MVHSSAKDTQYIVKNFEMTALRTELAGREV